MTYDPWAQNMGHTFVIQETHFDFEGTQYFRP